MGRWSLFVTMIILVAALAVSFPKIKEWIQPDPAEEIKAALQQLADRPGPESLERLANAHARAEDWRECANWWFQLARGDRENPRYQSELLKACQAHYDQRAIDSYPEEMIEVTNWALALLRGTVTDRSLKPWLERRREWGDRWFKEALALEDIRVYLHRAVLALEDPQLLEALEPYTERGAEIEPRVAKAYETATRERRWVDALACCDYLVNFAREESVQLASKIDRSGLLLKAGKQLAEEDRSAEALRIAHRILAEDPQDAWAQSIVAEFQTAASQPESQPSLKVDSAR